MKDILHSDGCVTSQGNMSFESISATKFILIFFFCFVAEVAVSHRNTVLYVREQKHRDTAGEHGIRGGGASSCARSPGGTALIHHHL